MNKKGVREYWRIRLDDMHMYRTIQEEGVQLFIFVLSVAAGILSPLLHDSPGNLSSSTFILALGFLANIRINRKRKKYFLGKLFIFACTILSMVTLVFSYIQMVRGTDDIGKLSLLPKQALIILVVVHAIDYTLFEFVDPPNQKVAEEITDSDAERIDAYINRAIEGKLGAVKKGGENKE